MSKITGDTIFWEIQAGYPDVKDAGEKVIVRYLTETLSGYPTPQTKKLAKGLRCPIAEHSDLEVADYTYRPSVSNKTEDVRTVFAVEIVFALADAANNVQMDEWTREDNNTEKPIEQHRDYRIIWNFHLARLQGVSGDLPNYSTYTNAIIPDGYTDKFKWIKDPSIIEEGWEIIASPSKPGVETFMEASPTVVHTRRYTTMSAAERDAAQTVVLEDPPTSKDFGIDAENWLKCPSGVYRDGEYWVVQNRYYPSVEGWDTDLY